MGGKGGDSGSGQQFQEPPATQDTGGWTYADGTTNKPKTEASAKTETTAPPITEDPTVQTGVEKVAQKETQPYAPPGFGNYPNKSSDLSGLGDVLVSGMQGQPAKSGAQQYQGQV
jgi:hypothetical protein